jgi:predicted  nucleic acid-binding Zn-ribbon protein
MTHSVLKRLRLSICLLLVASLVGCSAAYFGAMEKLGFPKRDLMVKRVKAAQTTQDETKEQFTSALERFKSIVEFDGGSLEDRYDALNTEYEESAEKAQELTGRIDAIEEVAEALFDEWDDELEEYSNSNLRANSERRLKETRSRYEPMMLAMRKAETSISPVLGALKDQVLYLKHNLNARAVGALRGELADVEQDVASLLRSMESSMKESQRFIDELETDS